MSCSRAVAFAFTFSAFVLGELSNAPLAAGEPAPPQGVGIEDVELGFQGVYKVGYWMPVTVAIRAGQEAIDGLLEVTVLDGDGVASAVTSSSSVHVGPEQRQAFTLYAKIGRLRSPVTAVLRNKAAVVAQRTLEADDERLHALTSDSELILVIGSAQSAKALFDENVGSAAPGVVAVEDPSALPDEWYGYDGLNAVVILTENAKFLAAFGAAEGKLQALDQWVQRGGRILLSAGRNAERVLSSQALARFAPGTMAGTVTLKQASALETYTRSSGDTETNVRGLTNLDVQVPRLVDVQGRIEVFAGQHSRDLPLVVRTPRGFGEVTFIGFDLAQPPLSSWIDRPRLLNLLLERKPATDLEQQEVGGQMTSLGYTDLSGQLRGAMEQFAQVPLISFSAVAGLILLYAIIIGPLDYLLVRRLLQKMELSWLTFALSVGLFSAGGVLLAHMLKGNEILINQVDVVDYDLRTRLIRGTTWSTVYSPRSSTYNVALRPRKKLALSPKHAVLTSWLGLPGSGFGAMDARTAVGALEGDTYSFTPNLARLETVPIPVRSAKAFTAVWTANQQVPLDAQLRDEEEGVVGGALLNRLPMTLTDCVLIYGRWVYQLGDMKPGAELRLDGQIDPQTVETYFRHARLVSEKDSAAPYDPAATDVPRIVETMLFYDLIGGKKFTGLSNEYQQRLDLSGVVRGGAAVLLARTKEPASDLELDSQTLAADNVRNYTFHRFIIPMETAEPQQR